MTRQEVLKELQEKYSFEKAHAIIQLAIEDGYYANDEVHVCIAESIAGSYFFSMHWKENE